MSGPVKRGGVSVEQTDDGRLRHRYRQSTLGELDVCPERGRLTLTGQMPRIETDAAALGTAAHAGFEFAMARMLTEEGAADVDEIIEVMHAEFDRIAELPNFEWKKYKRVRVYTLLNLVAQEFYDGIYPSLAPIGVEIPFKGLVIHEDDERIITIEGTIDLLDANIGAADWKTAGDARKFKSGFGGEAWKLERWGVQPTVYIQALLLMDMIDPDLDEWPFTYLAYALGGTIEFQTPTVYRHRGDLAWLVDRTLAYSKLIEAEISPWPLQDDSALCSEVWCPAWASCKGRHYQVGWPKPSLPAV